MRQRWNAYLSGGLAGVLLIASVAAAGHYFGASTTFARGAAAVEQSVGVDTARYEYFRAKNGKYGAGALPDGQLLFVLGIALESLEAALATGTFELKKVPDMWAARFGDRPLGCNLTAFVGGMVLIVGALAEGRLDAFRGLAGMLAGGSLYAALYPAFKATVLGLGNLGKVTPPQVIGVSHWVVLIAMSLLFLAMFRRFEKKGLYSPPTLHGLPRRSVLLDSLSFSA